MKTTYDDLADVLALRLTESMSVDELEHFFYEYQYEYYRKHADDVELIATAEMLKVIEPGEPLEIE